MGVSVTNNLPFELTSFQLIYKSLENEISRELFSTNIEPDKFSLPILPNTIAQKQIIINFWLFVVCFDCLMDQLVSSTIIKKNI